MLSEYNKVFEVKNFNKYRKIKIMQNLIDKKWRVGMLVYWINFYKNKKLIYFIAKYASNNFN